MNGTHGAVDWASAKEIFGEAIEAVAATRPAMIEARCGDDRLLRQAVLRLLHAHDHEEATAGDGPTLAREAGDPAATTTTAADLVPRRIGPYVVGDILGEGGFGVVVRAEQQEPIRREVAIKVFKPGRDGAAILRRFEIERDTLGRMDHPGIAAVHDAGRLEDGRPYVVMELVPGVPITAAVDAVTPMPTVRDRVALMVRVCRAIHHAHQRAVIHRDIKPSNILVSEQDGELRPRVIDFGIARAVGPEDRPGDTRAGDLLGTPRYMSPEQLAGGGGGDIRTDVHALGVVLCEILTGAVPRDPRTLVLQPGREVPAEPPSRLARRTGAGAEARTGMRTEARTEARTEDPRDPRDSRDSDVRTGPAPEAVRTPDARSLRGDLDRIVLKAVAWDPEQRYDSAAALADDLERFLAGEPVLAVGPSTSYRVRRFVSRHAIACGLGSAAVLAMLAGTALAMAGRAQAIDAGRRAADEARRATFVSRYFLEDMLAAADPDAAAGRDVTVAELLDVAARSAEPRFAGSPDLLADVASRIGAAYARVGRAVDAVPVLEAARVAEARIEIPDPERRLRIAFELADALSQHPERHAEGVALMRDVRTEAEAVLGPAHELSMQAWVADDVAGENDVADAVVRLLEIRRELEAQGLADSPTALRAAERLSVALGWLERRDEQVAVLRELVDLAGRRLGPVHSRTFTALHRLGMALIEQGEVDRGEAMVDDAHARASSIWPDSNPNLLGMRGEVISLKLALGHTADAVELARLAARGAEEHDGEGSIRHAMAMHRLAQAMVSDGQTDEAIQILEAILPLRRQQWGPDHPQVGTTLWVLAKAYADRERWEDAWMTAEAAIPRNRPNSMGRVESLVVRARALEAMGRPGEALDGLHAALDEARAAGHERLAVRLAEVLETFPSGG